MVEPIVEDTWRYLQDNRIEAIEHEQLDRIRALLLGHRIEKVGDDHLMLDDGTVIRVVPNEGGCACSAGDYQLDDLNGCDNIVTGVGFADVRIKGRDWADEHIYEVFVVAEDKHIRLLAVSGDDGNGYYGTGYRLLVRAPMEG